jgi:hypothetical protein
MNYYAHSLKDQPVEKWETIREHEELVAKYCEVFLKRIDPSPRPAASSAPGRVIDFAFQEP